MTNTMRTSKSADQLARAFMETLGKGDMETLMTFWADDGVLEFPFHPPSSARCSRSC
jgi:ketosteroid isomerase-like protein